MPQIIPQLSVRRGREALAFYQAALGAEVDYLVGEDEIVAQLSAGGATFWISDESPEYGNFSPETVGGGTVRMALVVPDPDVAMARAIAAGAREVVPVQQGHGWRLGRVVDPYGHHWEIGTPLGPWPPHR